MPSPFLPKCSLPGFSKKTNVSTSPFIVLICSTVVLDPARANTSLHGPRLMKKPEIIGLICVLRAVIYKFFLFLVSYILSKKLPAVVKFCFRFYFFQDY